MPSVTCLIRGYVGAEWKGYTGLVGQDRCQAIWSRTLRGDHTAIEHLPDSHGFGKLCSFVRNVLSGDHWKRLDTCLGE